LLIRNIMKKGLSYKNFKNKIFEKLDNHNLHKLFYFSLFDPSSWEEDFIFRKLININEIEKSIINIISKADKKFLVHFFEWPKERDKFFNTFVYSDMLSRFLIAYGLEKLGIRIDENSFKKGGPDIIVSYKNGERIAIELKRVVSGSNLRNTVTLNGEILKQIESFNEKKVILMFVFPQIGNEDSRRVFKLIEGYYIIEELIKERLKKDKIVKLLCIYVEKDYYESSEFNFQKIPERIESVIKDF